VQTEEIVTDIIAFRFKTPAQRLDAVKFDVCKKVSQINCMVTIDLAISNQTSD